MWGKVEKVKINVYPARVPPKKEEKRFLNERKIMFEQRWILINQTVYLFSFFSNPINFNVRSTSFSRLERKENFSSEVGRKCGHVHHISKMCHWAEIVFHHKLRFLSLIRSLNEINCQGGERNIPLNLINVVEIIHQV